NVFSGLDGLHVPAISFVARINILVESDIGVVFDRNTVVIPENDQVAQLLGARERGSLGSNAFLQITIGSNDVNVVVERRFPAGASGSKRPRSLRAAIAMPTEEAKPCPNG